MADTSSKTTVIYPITTALVKAEELLGDDRSWQAVNKQQKYFLSKIFARCRAEGKDLPEIESIVSWHADEVSAFLRQHGFSIELQPFNDEEFGVASVLDLLVEWTQVGTRTTLQNAVLTTTYPAVRLKESVQYYQSASHPYPIAAITTKSGDVVGMTMMDHMLDKFDLVDKVEQLSSFTDRLNSYGGLIFPMVDLNQRVDVSWLIGMWTVSAQKKRMRIAQVQQQTLLKMNEEGARAESAVGMSIRPQMFMQPKPDMIINKPFLVWFMRKGLSKPLFAGYITQENWKDPGSIR